MNGHPVLLDINVPMYAAGRAHPSREACVWAMTEITEGRLAAAIDTETVQEVLHRFGALGQWSTGVTMAESLLSIVPTIYPVLPADVRLAVELFAQHAPRGAAARDLLHVAVCRTMG